MILSMSGFNPVISRSIHTRAFESCGIGFSP
jgi:hypothetical protein